MSAFTKSYENVYAALSKSVKLAELVDVENNVYPLNDPGTPGPGALVVYGWIAQQWNDKARRGQGTLAIIASSETNKVEASRMMDLIREVMTAKNLSDGSVVFHLVREESGPGDGMTSPSGRFEIQAQFACKLVEG